MLLFCDLETYSTESIRHGAAKYAEGKGAKILLWGYAIDDEPAKVWQVGRERMPQDLRDAIAKVQDLQCDHVWHNGLGFDTVFIDKVRPDLSMPISNIHDTMLIAYQHGLPGALGDLCTLFGLPVDKAKDRDGARLIRMFCSPRPEGHDFDWRTHPEDWDRFVNYCRLDVEAERELYRKLPRFNCTTGEWCLMLLDAEINRRGMMMDVDLAKSAVAMMDAEGEELRDRTAELTGGAVDSATRTQALLKYINETYYLKLESLRKSEVERAIARDDMPEPAKELLRVRLSSAKSSIKKFQSILDCTCDDGRLRGCLQFRGASRTGRWAGRLFQPQNLTRPTMENDEIEQVIDAAKGGYLDLITSNVNEALSNCLRGTITVPDGMCLCVADFSNIEGRVLAWLADEKWKLDAFRAFDAGKGLDLYKLTYARSFGVDPHSVTKTQRQMGKVLELAMGYSGGAGAFAAFAQAYGIDLHMLADSVIPTLPAYALEEATNAYEWASAVPARLAGLDKNVWIACDAVKRLWREANPSIVALWKKFDDAAIECLAERRRVNVRDDLWFEMRGKWLLLHLPSGRFVCYPAALLGGEGEQCTFTYMGVNQLTRKWERIRTYSGKVTENCVQAVACDLLSYSLNTANEWGFKPILTVHDEILTEAPADDNHTYKILERAMEYMPMWASGLPLKAAGFQAKRYRK